MNKLILKQQAKNMTNLMNGLSSCDIGNPAYFKSPKIDYFTDSLIDFIYESDGETKALVNIDYKYYHQDGEVEIESFDYQFCLSWQKEKCDAKTIKDDIKECISNQFKVRVNF
jgi:hypothetical protein